MEIRKLGDNDVMEEIWGDPDEKELVITNLKQGVKQANRVNVFVNNRYSFSLDVSQVVDFKIKVGLKITEAQLADFKKASVFGKLYQRTLEWALVRPRSIKETKDYLYRKIRNSVYRESQNIPFGRAQGRSAEPMVLREGLRLPKNNINVSEFSDEIISRLLAKGYLDDERFAEYYVENRFVKKGISAKRLKMELMKKGIDRETIEKVLRKRDDEEEILKMIAKKRAKYNDESLIRYLCRQGFDYQLARSLVLGKD